MELDFNLLDKADIRSIVNNVDIEALQCYVENIVYCSDYTDHRDGSTLADESTLAFFKMAQYVIESQLAQQEETVSNLARMAQFYQTKKKSIAQKKKELLMIKDKVDILREDVKVKKCSVATMEALLQHKENVASSKPVTNKNGDHTTMPPSSSSYAKLKLHVADAKGYFVDILCERFTKIGTLLDDAIKLLALYDEDKAAVKILHKGISLNRDSKVEDCGIATGDTMLVIVVDKKVYEPPRPERIAAPIVSQIAVPSIHDDYEKIVREKDNLILEMNEMIASQKSAMKSIAFDIKNDVKNTLEATINQLREQDREYSTSMQVYNNNNNNSGIDEVKLVKIDERLENLESLIREVIVEKSFINAGDLESDDEDEHLDKIKTAEILISKLQDSLIETESAVTSIKEGVDGLKQKLLDVSMIDVTKSVERMIESALAASTGASANNLSVSTIATAGMNNLREEEEEDEAVMMLVKEIAEERIDESYLRALATKEEGEIERAVVEAIVSTVVSDIIDGISSMVIEEEVPSLTVTVDSPKDVVPVVVEVEVAAEVVAESAVEASPTELPLADATIKCSISTVVYSSGETYTLQRDNRINVTIVRGATQMDDLLLQIRAAAAARLQIPISCIAVGYNGYHVVTGEDAELLPFSVTFTVDKIPQFISSKELVIKVLDSNSSSTLSKVQVQKLVDNISINAEIMTKYGGDKVTEMFTRLQKYWDDPSVEAEIKRTQDLRSALEKKLRSLYSSPSGEGYSYNSTPVDLHLSSEEELAIFGLRDAEIQLSSDIENAILVQEVTSNPFSVDRLPVLTAGDIEVKKTKSSRCFSSNFKVMSSSIDSAIAALDDIPSDLEASVNGRLGLDDSVDLGGTGSSSSKGAAVTSSQVLRRIGDYEREEDGLETPVKDNVDSAALSALSKGASSLHASPFDDLNGDNDSLVLSEDVSFDSR